MGRGDRWQPPALETGGDAVSDEWWALVEAAGVLHDVPVAVSLGPGAIVGVVGPPAVARPVARSLVLQLAVAHGPADLLVAAVTAPGSPERGWLRWLPHAHDPDAGDRLVTADGDLPESLAGRAQPAGPCAPHVVLVVDDPAPMAARNAPVRELLAADRSSAAVVVAEAAASLPSICDVVVEARLDGTAVVHRPGRAELGEQVIAAGASARTARAVALALAGWHDPEQAASGAGLAPSVSLASLLPAGCATDPEEVRRAWEAAGSDPPLRTRLALAADGPIEVDLVRDGPHALVAGTTGAGKSELLRSLVAGLAVGTPPDLLAFVLVDYKGGAAFDSCARLPHVAAVVTDLDERLAERALRSLHAELRRREQLLRAAGAADLTDYRARAGSAPMPAPRHRRRRAGHPRAGPARLRALAGRRRAAGPEPGRAPRAGHPAPVGGHQRRHPGQHEPPHRPPSSGRGRVGRRDRGPRRGRTAPPSPGAGGAALRPGGVRGGTGRVGRRWRRRGRPTGHGGPAR